MRLSLEPESIRIFGDSLKDNLNSVARCSWEELFKFDAFVPERKIEKEKIKNLKKEKNLILRKFKHSKIKSEIKAFPEIFQV